MGTPIETARPATKRETKTEAMMLVVMLMLRHPPDLDQNPDDHWHWGPISAELPHQLLLAFFPQNVHPKIVKIVKYNTGMSLVFL